MATYYQILGVLPGAEPPAIKTAYRRLARKFHPDYNDGHPLAERRFRLLAEAWEVLQDEQRRSTYDRFGQQGLVRGRDRSGVVAGMERFMANLESLVESRLKQVPRRGEDRRRVLEVSLETACYGGEETVEVTRREPCDACGGTGAKPGTHVEACHVCEGRGRFARGTLLKAVDGCSFCQGSGNLALCPCVPCDGLAEREVTRTLRVDVPVAVETGRRLVLRGYGTRGANGAPDGDLFLEIHVAPHPRLSRDGADLRCTIPITLREAVLGGAVNVPLLRDEPVTIRIPARSTSGQLLRLKGRGVPRPDGTRGDLLARVEIETPVIEGGEALAALDQLERLSRYPRRRAWDAD